MTYIILKLRFEDGTVAGRGWEYPPDALEVAAALAGDDSSGRRVCVFNGAQLCATVDADGEVEWTAHATDLGLGR